MSLDSIQEIIVEGNSGFLDHSVCVTLTNIQQELARDMVLLLNTAEGTAGT